MEFDALSHKLVLADIINERKYVHVAEVGVKYGHTYLHLLENCPTIRKMLGIDIWESKALRLPQALKKLKQIIHEKYATRARLIKARSVDAAREIQDRCLDMVFIDADHEEKSVRDDIVAWRPKIRTGGMLCGHDCGQAGVKAALDALCIGWQEREQQVWSVDIGPQIICAIPYAEDCNLGRAYNEFMNLLPEDGWGVLLDHDAMFTTPNWFRQISRAIALLPEGSFVCRTNRIKCPFQQVKNVHTGIHDYHYHRGIGAKLAEEPKIIDVTQSREPSGVCMVISKKTWREIGGFPQGLHYVDRMIWLSIKAMGKSIYCIKDLYVYHYHRGNKEPIQLGQWASRHYLPNGIKIVLQPKRPLPAYDGKTYFD